MLLLKGLKATFWSSRQRRLRAGWRLLIQFGLFVATLLGVAVLTNIIGKGNSGALLGIMLYFAVGLALAWLMGRFIDRRPFADFGFHLDGGWWLDFGFGIGLGAVLMTGVFLSEQLAGWVSVTVATVTESGLAPAPAFLLSLFVYLAISFNEEFTSRGYQLRNLAEGLAGGWIGPRLAIVLALLLSSAFFGIAHALNPNATVLGTFNIVLAGLLLSLPYLLTGELATSIGLHLSWNLFQGTVYGFPVSGGAPTRGLLILQQSGPELWTGGAFGPEGGLLADVWILIGCGLIVLWVYARRKSLGLHVGLAQYERRASPHKCLEPS
jgi:uncharacterized protein